MNFFVSKINFNFCKEIFLKNFNFITILFCVWIALLFLSIAIFVAIIFIFPSFGWTDVRTYKYKETIPTLTMCETKKVLF